MEASIGFGQPTSGQNISDAEFVVEEKPPPAAATDPMIQEHANGKGAHCQVP